MTSPPRIERGERRATRIRVIALPLAVVLWLVVAGPLAAQTPPALPSTSQTPTPVFQPLAPPQLPLNSPIQLNQPDLSGGSPSPAFVPTAVGSAVLQPRNVAAAPVRQPIGWRLVPVHPGSIQAAAGGPSPLQGVVGQVAAPIVGSSIQPPSSTLPQRPVQMAAIPAELPYQFPKPNAGPNVMPNNGRTTSSIPANTPAAPTTRTTTWGELSSGPNGAFPGSAPGINYGKQSMQEPSTTGALPSGTMQEQTTIKSGVGGNGCAEDDQGQLEPIAAGQTAATSDNGNGISIDGETMGPNLNPPWINRIFPNANPPWMKTAIWRRFDCRRQKVSAGVRNVIGRRQNKRICKDGCNCWDCLRARRQSNRDFGGWIAWGGTFNSHGNRTSTGNDPLPFNNFANGLLLNQAWMYAERRADTTTRNFDFGYRVDFLFGADAPDTSAFGDQTWDFSWDTSGEYGFALPQAYATIAYKDLFINMGRFYTIVGYESVMAPDNFFYSHSLTFKYNEPITHTGVLAQYNWNSYLTAYAGYTTGWDAGYRNLNDGATFLGGLRFDVSDNLNLFYATSVGDPGDSGLGESDVYLHSLVANAQLTPNMNYIFQWDYQDRETFGFDKTNSYAINQYLLTRLSDRVAIGTRFEYFRDDDGARIANGPGNYFDLTFGLNYRTRRNFVLRPEIRYDWFDGDGLPFDDNTERDQVTVALGGYWLF